MLVTPPDPQLYRQTFLQVTEDKHLLDEIREGIVDGEAEALNQEEVGDLSNQRGSFAYFKRDRNIRKRLEPFGWYPDEVNRQRRIYSPVGRYDVDLQLLHGRGTVIGNTTETHPKGIVTVELVGINYKLFSGQKSLFDDDSEVIPRASLWAISTLTKANVVYTSIIMPETISDCKRFLYGSLVYTNFAPEDLTRPRMVVDELPEGVDVDFPPFTDREDIETGDQINPEDL